MDLKLEIAGCLCWATSFSINGIDANPDDFGEKYDHDPDEAEDYGCGDMQFTRNQSTPEVLAKYGITEEEYAQVAYELEDGLSFGRCGWCI